MSDSLTIKNEVDMINIENKVDAEKALNLIKDMKGGRSLKLVKMFFYDGLTLDEIVEKTCDKSLGIGNMDKNSKYYGYGLNRQYVAMQIKQAIWSISKKLKTKKTLGNIDGLYKGSRNQALNYLWVDGRKAA